jgi:hypothetical protein
MFEHILEKSKDVIVGSHFFKNDLGSRYFSIVVGCSYCFDDSVILLVALLTSSPVIFREKRLQNFSALQKLHLSKLFDN